MTESDTNTRVDVALELEGMTTAAGLTLIDILFQEVIRLTDGGGVAIEFGTYKGRVSLLIAQSMSTEAQLIAVEQADYFQLDTIKKYCDNVSFYNVASEKFCTDELSIVTERHGHVNLSHHDASHFFNNVYTELKHLYPHMNDLGIMILDDFNDYYPAVRAAYYKLRYTTEFPFELLLIGFNKAILVHQSMVDLWTDFILSKLEPLMLESGYSIKLHRTDDNLDSRCFFVAPRAKGDVERYYGTKWFGDRFYKAPSP